MTGGHERQSDFHWRAAEEIPGLDWTAVSSQGAGRVLKGAIPSPSFFLPFSLPANSPLGGVCPSKKEGEGSKSDRQDKRVKKGALWEISALGSCGLRQRLHWVT